jgi:hypothetical protein
MRETKRSIGGRRTTFPIGGKVLVRMGPTKRRAEVVEDRGPIGRGGRRILRVRFVVPNGEPQPTFEVPLDHVTAVKTRAGRPTSVKAKMHTT